MQHKKTVMSSHLEDYLKTIALLTEEHGHAHSGDIARLLNVSRPSVTSALKKLAQSGYIDYSSNIPVQLTPEGKRYAETLLLRYQCLKKFFLEILFCSQEKAASAACIMEHKLDNEILQSLQVLHFAIEEYEGSKELRQYLYANLCKKEF